MASSFISSEWCSAGTTHQQPFFHYVKDNFLSEERYAALLREFPDDSAFPDITEENKKRLNSRRSSRAFDQYLQTHATWKEFIEALSSEAFLSGLLELAAPALQQARGLSGIRSWNYAGKRIKSGLATARSQKIRVVFEFSQLNNGSYIPPHTDSTDKLVTMMFYLADNHKAAIENAGTVFYQSAQNPGEKNWYNRKLDFSAVTPVAVNDFMANRICVFVKSDRTYHGLPELHMPANTGRNSLNVNIYRRRPKRFRKLRARLDDYYARFEKLRNDWL